MVRSSDVPRPIYTLSTWAPVNPSLNKVVIERADRLHLSKNQICPVWRQLDLCTPRSHLKSKVLTSAWRRSRKKFFGLSPSKTAFTFGLNILVHKLKRESDWWHKRHIRKLNHQCVKLFLPSIKGTHPRPHRASRTPDSVGPTSFPDPLAATCSSTTEREEDVSFSTSCQETKNLF